MIPTFPEFKKIEITDKDDIENFNKDYPPYSDFNFISLFCWDVDGKRRVSMLNGNLVVRMTCDTSGKEFLTFLGTNKVPETINTLFEYAKKEGLKQELRMITQETVNLCSDASLSVKIEEDRDNFDYIYLVEDLYEFDGAKYAKFRNKIRKFERCFGEEIKVETLSLQKKEHREYITKVCCEWDSVKERYSQREERAVVRLLNSPSFNNLIGVIVSIGSTPIAFSINETFGTSYSIGHFAKVDYRYSGVFPYLVRETARALKNVGCEIFNMEEDLGLPGLRNAKESYCPIDYKRKYSIESNKSFMQKTIAMVQSLKQKRL